jgi:hypothetical protein
MLGIAKKSNTLHMATGLEQPPLATQGIARSHTMVHTRIYAAKVKQKDQWNRKHTMCLHMTIKSQHLATASQKRGVRHTEMLHRKSTRISIGTDALARTESRGMLHRKLRPQERLVVLKALLHRVRFRNRALR